MKKVQKVLCITAKNHILLLHWYTVNIQARKNVHETNFTWN